MRYVILISSILICSFCVLGQQHIETDDYKIEIPNEWIPLSSEYVKTLTDKNKASIQAKGAEYPRSHIIGFCLSDTLAREAPFLLGIFNELKNYNSVSFDSIITVNCDPWKSLGIETNPIIDRDNFRFYLELELSGLFLFMAYIPGETGILQLSFYSEIYNQDLRRTQFLEVYNSVEHFKPFYEDHKAEGVEKELKNSALLIAVIIAIIALWFYFIKKEKRNLKLL